VGPVVLLSLPLSILLLGLVLGLLSAAAVALWHRRFRRAVSSVVAIAMIPACFISLTNVPIFDPWLWYVLANRVRFDARMAHDTASDVGRFAVIEVRDVSVGLAGLKADYFVALVYDESDAVGLAPPERPRVWQSRGLWPAFPGVPIPKGRRLWGHYFRVDDFE
jgi:hypothetical protein